MKPPKGAKKAMSEISYTRSGDYLIPNISLTPEDMDDTETLGRYGMMRKAFLKEHRPINYNRLLLSGKLYPHLREIDRAATQRLEAAMSVLTAQSSLPDKAADAMAWTAAMYTLRASAEEMVKTELIYS
jgi:hypothetical protein